MLAEYIVKKTFLASPEKKEYSIRGDVNFFQSVMSKSPSRVKFTNAQPRISNAQPRIVSKQETKKDLICLSLKSHIFSIKEQTKMLPSTVEREY